MDKAIVKKYDDIKVPAYIQARIGQYDQISIPPSDFETDGCSGGMSKLWRKVFKTPPPWEECCVEHDYEYWLGGTWPQRLAADLRLAACVADPRYGGGAHPFWAIIMFLAVHIGGAALWPVPWRWGYGWKYPRSRNERKLIPPDPQYARYVKGQ